MAKTKKPKFLHPRDISMTNSPLVEAWLTIQWELQGIDPQAPIAVDPGFNTALVKFASGIMERFGEVHPLDTNQIPEQMAPFRPRYQFRKSLDSSPIIQLGPGIATVNFTSPYSWKQFKNTVSWIRPRLISAYDGHQQKTSLLSLKYRSAVPFNYANENLLGYLESHLNSQVAFPKGVPGQACAVERPRTLDLTASFQLGYPKGMGNFRIATGTKQVLDSSSEKPVVAEHVIFELEVISMQNDVFPLTDKVKFDKWLEEAHSVIHDWFLSLIQGPLEEELGLTKGAK